MLGSVSRPPNPPDQPILVLIPHDFNYCLVFPSSSWKRRPLQMARGVAACFSQTRMHVLNIEPVPWLEPLVRSFSVLQGTWTEQLDARVWFVVEQTPRLVQMEAWSLPLPFSLVRHNQRLAMGGFQSPDSPREQCRRMSDLNIPGRWCKIIIILLYWKPHFSRAYLARPVLRPLHTLH